MYIEVKERLQKKKQQIKKEKKMTEIIKELKETMTDSELKEEKVFNSCLHKLRNNLEVRTLDFIYCGIDEEKNQNLIKTSQDLYELRLDIQEEIDFEIDGEKSIIADTLLREYDPFISYLSEDGKDYARHMLENYTIEEVEIMLKRIYDVVPYINNLKKRVEELTQKKLKETFPKFYK